MKSLIILSALAASLAHAAWQDHEEVRELRLDTAGISTLNIDAGAGSLEVLGVQGASSVHVSATLVIPGADADEAAALIARHVQLELVRDGGVARLTAGLSYRTKPFGESPRINLEVRVPHNMALRIDDGSGAIDIRDIDAAVYVDDGSGSISIQNIGKSVTIDDGSGTVRIADVQQDVYVGDSSGAINIRRVKGSVTVDDGSGSIEVHDVGQDLILLDDGSGELNYSQIQGKVVDRS